MIPRGARVLALACPLRAALLPALERRRLASHPSWPSILKHFFIEPLELHHFPFDLQELGVTLRSDTYPVESGGKVRGKRGTCF